MSNSNTFEHMYIGQVGDTLLNRLIQINQIYIMAFFRQTALGPQIWWLTPKFWKMGFRLAPTNFRLNSNPVYRWQITGLPICQKLPCPLAIWSFTFGWQSITCRHHTLLYLITTKYNCPIDLAIGILIKKMENTYQYVYVRKSANKSK